MKSFKGYIKENFKELVKVSCAVDPRNTSKFEGLLKKENFGYNGPMDSSRYEKLGLDEFIIVGPSTPVMKWVGKNKAMIIKLAKLPMPKITFASVDVNQYDGENLFEAITGYKPHTGPNDTLAYHLPKQLKSMKAFLNLVQKHPKVKNVDQEKLKAGGRVVFKTFYKTDPNTQAELMRELDKLEKKFNEFNGQTNESVDAMSKKQKAEFDKLYKKMDGGKEHQAIKRKEKNPVKADDMFHALVMKKVLGEAIDHPAYINVTLQDFAKHMKRIKPHGKKAGVKLTVQGKDVRVDGLATAIKKMFDFMTSDGKGFYE